MSVFDVAYLQTRSFGENERALRRPGDGHLALESDEAAKDCVVTDGDGGVVTTGSSPRGGGCGPPLRATAASTFRPASPASKVEPGDLEMPGVSHRPVLSLCFSCFWPLGVG